MLLSLSYSNAIQESLVPQVVGFACGQGKFADRDAERSSDVELLVVLHRPARRDELLVDGEAGSFFGDHRGRPVGRAGETAVQESSDCWDSMLPTFGSQGIVANSAASVGFSWP